MDINGLWLGWVGENVLIWDYGEFFIVWLCWVILIISLIYCRIILEESFIEKLFILGLY